MPALALIGFGAIGRAVAQGLPPGWRLASVLRRDGDAAAFLATRHDLIVEAAGPGALRAHGAAALATAPVWSVGAAALADPALRAALAAASARSGHRLRLFANGIAGVLPPATTLSVTMRRPGLPARDGALADLLRDFPDELNSATAASLAGPGIEATRVTLQDSGPGGPHEILAAGDGPGGRWTRTIRFPADPAIHPVAATILAALARETGPFAFD